MISKMKFEMLKLSGQIVKVLLMPASCGGDPGNPLNIIWMYKAAAKQKDIFDDQVTSLVSEYGGSWNYVAEPSYEDNNPMVASLRVTATADDGAKLEIQIPNSVDVNP
ncbi:MAG: hypothetical protein K2Z81_10225, partial [Cyanobacteria bacterium]|nr:hypothetical protein [Cyanobacteriota bacterium]